MIKRFTSLCALLVLGALPALCLAKALAPNTGDIDLTSHLDMQVHITQQGGACRSGYGWNATYGGCRRAVTEQEQQRETCGTNYAGEQTRVRERTQYILQSTGQTANTAWGAWSTWDRSACVAQARAPGVTPGTIALVLGSPFFESAEMTPRISLAMPNFDMPWIGRYHNTVYAVTLDRTSAQLRCIFAWNTTVIGGGSSDPATYAWLFAGGESVHTNTGYCALSQDKTAATLWGSCDVMDLAGEAEGCVAGMRTVSILSVSPCAATVEIATIERLGKKSQQRAYALCTAR